MHIYGSIPTVARETEKSGEGENGCKADAKLTGRGAGVRDSERLSQFGYRRLCLI